LLPATDGVKPHMTEPTLYKIDRRQRMHTNRVVVRVYQVFGTERYGWDTNREQPPEERPLYDSRVDAEQAADDGLARAGHTCDDACYRWRDVQ